MTLSLFEVLCYSVMWLCFFICCFAIYQAIRVVIKPH